MKRMTIPRSCGIALAGLIAVAAVLSMACGGTESKVEAQQGPAATEQSAPAVLATSAPTAVPTIAATPAITPDPANPAAAEAPPPTAAAPVVTEAPTASATPGPAAPVDVTVSLSEFKIESSLTTFQAGVPYHFIITNRGVVTHEANVANVNATGEVPVGATKTLDVTFTDPGQQEFACHITGHYQAGMKLPVTIG